MILQKRAAIQAFLPILLIFILVSCFTVIFVAKLKKLNIDQPMLIIGNTILFIVTALSFALYRKALYAGNTQVFLRNVYSGMFIKFFVCLAAAFIYIYSAGSAVNTPGLFSLMFLYLVYTFLEIGILLKQSKDIKQNKNA